MLIRRSKALAGAAGLRHNSLQVARPGGRCSQGGVKFPTGGEGAQAQARERLVLRESSPDSLEKKGQQIRCDSEADG